MAEEEAKQNNKDESFDDSAELARILSEAGEEEVTKGGVGVRLTAIFKDKRLLIAIGLLLIICTGGGIFWFLSSKSDPPKTKLEKSSTKEVVLSKEKDKIKKEVQVKKTNVFPLEPFFIPLELKNPEMGQFVSLKMVFVMSNRKLIKEINKNIGEIRRQIYGILKRKKSISYIEDRVKLKEHLRHEITTTSNNLLVSGAGTISDVLFTDFVIR